MTRARFALTVLVPLSAVLSACGLQPMYAGGSDGSVARGFGAIEVGRIEGQAGWLVRNAVRDRLGVTEHSTPQYRLVIRLDDALEGLAVLSDDTISRERRILRARYQLIDLSNNDIVLDATAGSDAGIDVVSSEYATIAAEQTALENLSREIADQIVRQIALTLRETP